MAQGLHFGLKAGVLGNKADIHGMSSQIKEELRRMEQEGQRFYGPHYFSAPAYLQYELTRLKLDFVQPCEKVREGGFCPDFTEQEKRDFYEQNRDLFGRYHGDHFTYEEVSQIIEKRLREDAYDKLIRDILCESENRQ